MKKTRMIALASIAAVGLAVFSAFIAKNQNNSWYKPTTHKAFTSGDDDDEAQSANGAMQWWFDRTKNQVTGQVDLDEVIRVQELAKQALAGSANQRNSGPTSTASTVSLNEI